MVVAAIDAGTTGVRCMIVDANGEELALGRKHWTYETPPNLEIAKEFNASNFWRLTCEAIRDATASVRISASDVKAVATTSQRHGIVCLDEHGKAVYAGPNIDARGAMTQYVIEDEMGTVYQEITGCWPPLMYAPTRLAWFEEEDPERFARIRHVLPISDWLTYSLCGAIVTDPSAASGTGFLDVRKRSWSQEVADLVGVDLSLLPVVHEAGSVVGHITAKAAAQTGLPAGLNVVQGGSDTSCALLAAQAKREEITVIAGSTTPVMLVIDTPICSADQAIWTGCHIRRGEWVLESNATLTGAYLNWIVHLLCERSDNSDECIDATYNHLADIVNSVPAGSNDTYVALGPSIMNCKEMTRIRMARMFFPQPALPQVIPLSSAGLIRGVIENIAYATRGNIEQLQQYTKAAQVKTIGGMTKSRAWPAILSNVISHPVMFPVQSEGSLLGAAICASVGAGIYNSFEDAMNGMVRWSKAVEPDAAADAYNSYYTKWREIWCRGDGYA